MPVPSAVISVPISAEASILSKRARSTFRILPRSGRIAWLARLRACLAEPPAESPSTMNSSLTWPGRAPGSRRACPAATSMSSAPLRRVSSRALRAASRAAAASTILPTIFFASAGCSSNQWPSCSATTALDHRPDLGGDQLVLGLRRELRVRHLDREHAGQALAHVVAGERRPSPSWRPPFADVGLDGAGQRAAEAGQMGAAVALRDVVGEAQHRLVIAVVPLHRDFDGDAVALALDGMTGW